MIFIILKITLIVRNILSTAIIQTRARSKIIECAQAFIITISTLIGIFLTELFADWNDMAELTAFNIVVFFLFNLYCAWFVLLCFIYTLMLLYAVCFCKTKFVRDTLKEWNYRVDPREN